MDRIAILVSNENESVCIYMNGDELDDSNITDQALYDAFWNDDLHKHLDILFEEGKFECDSYKMEIVE